MQGNQQMLHKAINEGLLTLGEPIRDTIQWHLRANGIFLDTEEDLDVRRFYEHLGFIIGNIADMVMDEIYDNLSDGGNRDVKLNQNDPVLDRIEQLLAINAEAGGSLR